MVLSNWRMRASGRPSAALTDRCLQCCWMPFHSPAGIDMVAFWAWFGRPNGVPNGSKMNPKWLPGGLLEHLRLLKASWSGLGGLLERSWAALRPKKSLLDRLLAAPRRIMRPVSARLGAIRLPNRRPRGSKMESKRRSELKTRFLQKVLFFSKEFHDF